jgi:hypothetical protein
LDLFFILLAVFGFLYEIQYAIQQLKERRALRVLEKKINISSDITPATLSRRKRITLMVLGQIDEITSFRQRLGLGKIVLDIEKNYMRGCL